MGLRDNLPLAGSPRAARSVQRILDAAARLFGREGYQGASMGQVAEEAGVSKGLLHYHFRSKEHLLIEAQRATFRQIHARFDDRFRQGDVGIDTALEALDALWEALYDMRKWAPFMVETMSLATQQGPVREHLDTFYAESDDLLRRGLEQVFDADAMIVPPPRMGLVIRAALHGLVIELAFARSDADIARVQQTYRDLRSIFADAAGATSPPSSQVSA